jgi:hypothetical protein
MIFWTRERKQRIILGGRSPSTAPMETISLSSSLFGNRSRRVVVIFAFLGLISMATTLGFTQIKPQKRVTALQLGDAADGARVTIVSDSALNDYEAFRRGDRFYVKIPVADFAAASPTFRGNGFEDVRVQEVGDSVVVSFKLQPGATARVDQRSNRLDVIFSTVSSARNTPPVNSDKSFPTSRTRRNASDSAAAAGPVPPLSADSFPQSGRNASSDYSPATSTNSFRETNRGGRSSRGNVSLTSGGQNNRASAGSRDAGSQSRLTVPPATTPNATSSPFGTPASPIANATPVPTVAQSTSAPVAPAAKTTEVSSWDSRMKFLKTWAKLNRNALIIGGIVALALLAGLVLWSRLKGRGTPAAKPTRKTQSQPVSEKVQGRAVVADMPPAAASVAASPVAAAPRPRKDAWVPQPATAGFATAAKHEHRDVEQDREVFEL